MSNPYTLPLSDPSADLALVGGKGASLARLVNAGLPVPDGFHITTAAYWAFVDENALQPLILEAVQSVDPSQPATLETASAQIGAVFARGSIPGEVAAAIDTAYAALDAGEAVRSGDMAGASPEQLAVPVAVRSSATAEDLPDLSFAGQQETFLNVRSAEAVLEAVKRCWASLWTARAIGYRVKNEIDQDIVSLAVVVQRLIPAEAAGIMFTANPINGRRDQIMISASWGLGEAVVGGMVTPDTFTVDKKNGSVIACEIAHKQTMTVGIAEGTEEKSVPESQRDAPVLHDDQATELARMGARIEVLYEMPMDIEWAVVDGVFSILQARPITALPEPELAPPAEWIVPDLKAFYYRASIVELLPDPLKPLFATLGLRAVDKGTLKLFTELLGPGLLQNELLITLHGYAYYQLRLTPKLLLLALLKTWSILKVIFRGEERWRDEARPRYLEVIKRWRSRPLHEVPAAELLEGAHQITAEAVNIYNVYQSGVVGQAIMAESLFTRFYEKLVQRKDDPPALTFLLGGDSTPIRAEKSLYDVADWCRGHPELSSYLLKTPSEQLASHMLDSQPPPNVASEVWVAWLSRFQAHLTDYGHAIYDLDFSVPVPADDPAPLLEMIKLYLQDRGVNPHERQGKQIAQREEASRAITSRLKGLRLKWFQRLLDLGQRYVPMREDNLADIGLGYPLLRQMLHELGERLVQAGMLENADDVHWLYETEAVEGATALDNGTTLSNMAEEIRRRKAEWWAARRVEPPISLPERSGWSGFMERFGPARTSQEDGDTIQGVAASPGSITTQACVLHGPEDFERMQPGAALVAAITTPAWTPLFAMASAVVTDIGGPLSHGSIVAREYGIPAVLGTGAATKRIQNGQRITVDGDSGTVTLLDEVGEERS